MLRSAAAAIVMAAALIASSCTRTSGYPPSSCADAADMARDHINEFDIVMKRSGPAVTAIENPRETKVVTGTGRYKQQRFCAADARLADGTSARALYVISDKQDGWLAGFGFYACLVGRSEGCTEETP